jgi:prepilin-type N-terminal cleavage/methylation domain-containing protein
MNQRGYSLIELLVAISLTSILLLSVGRFVLDSIRSTNQDYNQTLVFVNTKSAVEIVARAVREARAVQAVNRLPDNYAPGAPGNLTSWSGTAGSGATLILSIPSRDTSNNLIYADGLHTNLYTDDVIFYLNSSNNRLYKRTIANPNAPSNRAETTCPPANATASCPADKVIVEDVANLTTTYLDGNGSTTNTPSGTEAVRYTVTESKMIGLRTYTGSYTTTAAMRNK